MAAEVSGDSYEADRRTAEGKYCIELADWLKQLDSDYRKTKHFRAEEQACRPISMTEALKALEAPDLPSPAKEDVKCSLVLILASLCADFGEAELRAYVELLKLKRLPPSQAVNELEKHTAAMLDEIRRRKWAHGLDEINRRFEIAPSVGRMPFQKLSLFSSIDEAWLNLVERPIRDLVRRDLEPGLWSLGNEPAANGAGTAEPAAKEAPAAAAPNGKGNQGSGASSWDAVEISFLSDERVQICNGLNLETRNYHELGLADHRNGKPNKAWETLRILAESRGTISQGLDGSKVVKQRHGTHAAVQSVEVRGRKWKTLEKRVQEIRKALRSHFNIAADPILFIEGTGYQACFKIGCSPSFHT